MNRPQISVSSKVGVPCLAIVVGLLLSACSDTANSVLPTSSDQPLVTGAPEIEKIDSNRGTGIAVLVNNTPITNNQIKRRAAFVRLRRIKGNSTTIATNELIDEAIQMQEASRIGAVASSSEVDAAYARFAKSNKMSVSTMDRMLTQAGVTSRGFKDFIRASISWQRTVSFRAQSEASGTSTAGGATRPSWLPAAGTSGSRETEYTVQQIVFIIPQSKRAALTSRRRLEAERFRSQLNGCSNARQLASVLKDVTVIDQGRMLGSQLPPRWAAQIKTTPAGKVTRIQNDSKGLEMIVVCKTREVVGSASDVDADLLSGGGKDSASEVEKKFMAELKKRAVIKRR